ncbi:MAG TPA: NUDIX hydrolase [Blastocatellia bacterium]|jgi:8-oxo-dGTP diphosphatase|nr:NUDIX hydrolase [Blastocatellia bacterium]
MGNPAGPDEIEIVAAGGVVIAAGRARAPLVLAVHRPKYDDWSFPKGKAEPGETIEQAAAREVREETGLTCRVIRELQAARYKYKRREGEARPKVVYYFLMEPTGGSLSVNNYEVDRAEWFEVEEAMRLLSYEYDRALLRSVAASDFK